MFELTFGLIWELVSLPILIFFICMIPTGELDGIIILGFFALIFNTIGFGFLYVGIKKTLRDKNTDKYGEECYGKVLDVHPNGVTVNGQRQYDAEVEVFVKSLGNTIKEKELSGTGMSDYNVGDYVKVKYFNGDINFIEKVYPDYLPVDAKQALEQIETKITSYGPSPQSIIYESRDIIQVDGVRYKRI